MIADRLRTVQPEREWPTRPSRRQILGWGGALAGHLWAQSVLPARSAAGVITVVEQPWGRIDRLAEGVWAVVSTPFASNDWTTICNGGIVAGSKRVLMVEAFGKDEGARAVAEAARELAGRWPTDVAVTHFHADHTGGFAGLIAEGETPKLWITGQTRDLVRGEDSDREVPQAELRRSMLESARVLDIGVTTELDLGGVSVTLQPRAGHTPSDLTVRVEGSGVIFAGDLVWNGLFPNYRDAIPSRLSRAVDDLRRERVETYVSGHGEPADRQAFDLYSAVVEDLGAAARRAIESGTPAKEAAAEYRLPEAAAEWVLFNPAYFEVAIGAWFKEAEAGPS